MATLVNYWSCYSDTTSIITGIKTISIQIPGTYTGFTPVDQGRTIIQSLIAFANPTMGDKITAITVTDTGGVMPAGDQAYFPAYPVLGTYGDPSVAAGNKVMFLAPSGPGWTNFVPAAGAVFIPSQMYVNITFQKASIVSDTVYINLQWQKLI